jgi:hypothetical protein
MRNDVKPSVKRVIVPDAEDDAPKPLWEQKTFLFVPKNTVKRHTKLTT